MAVNMKLWILGIGVPVVLASTYWSGGMPSKKERIRLKEELKESRQATRTTQLALQGREATLHQLEARRQLDLAIQEIGGRNYGVARQHVSEALARLKKIEYLKNLDFSLDEIKTVIEVYYSEETNRQGKLKIIEILQAHLKETDEKIAAFQQFRAEVIDQIARLQKSMEETPGS